MTQPPLEQGTRVVRAGDLEIDLDRGEVRRRGETVSLTGTEWKLLAYLAQNAGKVLLNDEILRDVWRPEYEGDFQYLRVWISRLRRKLEPGPGQRTVIKTMQAIGYVLDAKPPTDHRT